MTGTVLPEQAGIAVNIVLRKARSKMARLRHNSSRE
jgi:hypothetical protein